MNAKSLEELLEKESRDLTYVIRKVGERGVTDREVEADDYGLLLARREFRDLVVGELYETYFLPERHEFEWQILHQLVSILTSEKAREFVGMAITGGVVGNTAFAVLRAILSRIVSEISRARLPRGRQAAFLDMQDSVTKLEEFFAQHDHARIAEIESFTKVPREKIHPFLKLLGFKHERRANNCLWRRPGSQTP